MGRSPLRSGGLYCASVLTLALVCAGYGSAFGAAFIKVPGDASTIQAGVDLAVSGDTVAVAAGTYVERVVVNKDVVLLGGWNSGFTARDPSSNETIINAQASPQDAGQPIRLATGRTSETVIDGFTLTGGIAPLTTNLLGGGIYCNGSSPVINNNVIVGNGANFGAGIVCVNGADALITNNTINENSNLRPAGEEGCGIMVRDSSPTIRGNLIKGNSGSGIRCERSAPIIEDNHIESNTHGAGVACLENSPATVRGNTFTKNRARFGAALWIRDSSPTVTLNLFDDNETEILPGEGGGGALSVLTTDNPPAPANPTIRDNRFYFNFTTTDGGAIHMRGEAQATIENNLFKENSTFGGGGAIVVQGNASAQILSNTFYRNSAPEGGTILIRQAGFATLDRNIVFGSKRGGGIRVNDPATAVLTCNCVSNNVPGDYVGISPGSTDIQLNPIFCRTDGDTLDLAVNSPCLPGGNPCNQLIGAFGEGTCGAFPANFSLLRPVDNFVSSTDQPTFRWSSSFDPDGGSIFYELEYSGIATFDTSVVVNTGSDTSYALVPSEAREALKEGVTYYWHVTAVDEQSNTTTSNEIWKLRVDTTFPTITLGVHQHPYLDAYLDLYAVIDEQISGDLDVAMTLGGTPQDVDFELIDPNNMVYSAPFKIEASGTAILNVSAADLAGNLSAEADTFALQLLRPGAASSFSSPDGALAVSVREGTFSQSAYFMVKSIRESSEASTLIPASPQHKLPPAAVSGEAGTGELRSRVYSVTWSSAVPAFPLKLTFREGADAADDAAGIYRWGGEAWEELPTYRDVDTGEFYTLTSRRGLYQLRTAPGSGVTHATALYQNFPNPFRGSTTVAFTVGGAGGGSRAVSIKIFDVSGRLVRTLLEKDLAPGPYAIAWDGDNSRGDRCPSGLYFYRLEIENESPIARKMILTR